MAPRMDVGGTAYSTVQTRVISPRVRASVSAAPFPNPAIVSVTTGHGTSLMAPSNSRNTTTRPLRTRPDQSAGFETGAVSNRVGMTCSIGDARSLDERRGRGPTELRLFFSRNALRASARASRTLDLRALSLLHRLHALRPAVAHQAVEMHADVGGFRRGVGECDGAVEGLTRLVVAAELH